MNLKKTLAPSNTLFWLVLIALLLVLGQFQRLQVSRTAALYLHDFVIVIFVVLSLPKFIFQKKMLGLVQRTKLTFTHVLIGLLGVATIFSYINGFFLARDLSFSLLNVGRFTLYAWFGWMLWHHLEPQWSKPAFKEHAQIIVWLTILLIGILIWWLGIWQYLLLPDTRFLYIQGWDDHYYRLISTQFDPGYTGAIFVLTWLFLQHKYFGMLTKWRKVLSIGLLVGLALTYSRASYLMLGVSLALLLLTQTKQWRHWLAYGFLFAGSVLLLPQPASEGVVLTRTSTIVARQQSALTYLQDLSPQNLLIGKGIFTQAENQATIALADHANVADNWILTLLSGLGGVGFGIYLWLIGAGLKTQWQNTNLWAIQTIALLVFGLFNNIFQPFIFLIWLLMGIVQKLAADAFYD